METREQIGKVTLDYTYYPGEDFYCDGAVEDELLAIAKNYGEAEFPTIIEERKSWPVLYHLSSQRENIVSWLPIDKSMKVLEIGSGCGAITGALSKKAGTVHCVDLSRKRSLINAYRHENCDNVIIHVGNFQDIEPHIERDYDCALLIGVLEYGQLYIGGETPFEDFLKIIRKHLKSDGSIVIAIENKYGLKYWAGCREDHLGTFFSNIENYPEEGGVRTFSRQGLEKIFANCGETNSSFYYPYPDYKFMTTLFSDNRLPMKGELINNARNYDRDRMQLFDERMAFDGILNEDMFPFFSNSYLVILGNRPKTDYIRYSNDRALPYQISTEILTENHKRLVKKHALSNESRMHIQKIAASADALTKRYDTKKLLVNPVIDSNEDSATFPFEKGRNLSELFDEYLEKDDIEGFTNLFTEYVNRIGYHEEMPIADYDLVFSNILVEQDTWTLIDYEWTFDRQISTKEIAFRALYCYLLEDEKRNKFNYDLILKQLGISPETAADFREQEMKFQKEVTGKRMSMSELRDLLGQPVIVPQKSLLKEEMSTQKKRVQIYEDKGNGFSEEQSYFVEEFYDAEGQISFSVNVPSETKNIRIDPCMYSCMAVLQDVSLNGIPLLPISGKRVHANGRLISGLHENEMMAVFASEDPNITIQVGDVVKSTGNQMKIAMKVTPVSMQEAQILEKELKRKIRL